MPTFSYTQAECSCEGNTGLILGPIRVLVLVCMCFFALACMAFFHICLEVGFTTEWILKKNTCKFTLPILHLFFDIITYILCRVYTPMENHQNICLIYLIQREERTVIYINKKVLWRLISEELLMCSLNKVEFANYTSPLNIKFLRVGWRLYQSINNPI